MENSRTLPFHHIIVRNVIPPILWYVLQPVGQFLSDYGVTLQKLLVKGVIRTEGVFS